MKEKLIDGCVSCVNFDLLTDEEKSEYVEKPKRLLKIAMKKTERNLEILNNYLSKKKSF